MPRCGCIGKPTIGPSMGWLKAKWSKSRKGSNGLARLGPNDRRSSTPAPSITNWGSMMSRAIRIRPCRKVALSETDRSHPYYIEAGPDRAPLRASAGLGGLRFLRRADEPGGGLPIGLVAAAQHLRQLGQALFGGQRAHRGESPSAALDFLDAEVLMAVGGQLRQVGDAQHLVVARQAPQLLPHDAADAPADPLIDLVEDQSRRLVGASQDALQAEHQARRLAAGGDLGQRLQPFPRIGRYLELCLVQPGARKGHTPAVGRSAGPFLVPVQIDGEARPRHVQVLQFGLDAPAQFPGGLPAHLGEVGAKPPAALEAAGLLCRERRDPLAGTFDLLALLAGTVEVGQNRFFRSAVFS